MSRGALERVSGSRLGQLRRQLAKRGTIAVAVAAGVFDRAFCGLQPGGRRLVPEVLAVHGRKLAVAGPGLVAITFFSHALWATVSEPTWENPAIALAAAALGLTGLALFAKRWLRSG
jgi:hypothetical protein